MSVTSWFRRVVAHFFDNTESNFLTKPSEIEEYLSKFPQPQDDFDRAFYHYKATMYQFNKNGPATIILNIAGLFAYYPYLMILLLKGKRNAFYKEYSAVFLTDRVKIDTIPTSVTNRYPSIKSIKMAERMSLSNDDLLFLRQVTKKYRTCYYFRLKVLLKIAMISDAIRGYKPKAIITYSESSFSTSIATKYCESNGIKLIGIMHGERDFALKLAFFRCTEYYAWDWEYVDILLRLRCDKDQFRVEVPPALALPNYSGNANAEYDYTFYLQDENDDTLTRLINVCELFVQNGKSVIIRPHPDFMSGVIEKLGGKFSIEDPRQISLVTSFENTKCVIAKFSTVLFQAWYNGIPVVIDDYTLPGLYDILSQKGYVILKKPHRKLTEIIDEMK